MPTPFAATVSAALCATLAARATSLTATFIPAVSPAASTRAG